MVVFDRMLIVIYRMNHLSYVKIRLRIAIDGVVDDQTD